jgi:leader peptidase (prepilin peptidase)/N-methyltransferase
MGEGWLSAPLVVALLGTVASAGVSLAIAGVYGLVRQREGFGMGDVKLLGAIGVYLGLYGVLVLFAGSIIGTVYGLIAARGNGGSLAFKFPFGPFLALAAVLVALFGPAAWGWYAGLLG